MATTKIPLILPATARGWATSIGASAKDQQLINGLYQVSVNSGAGSKAVYLQKRSGTTTGTTFASGVVVLKHRSSFFTDLYATATKLYKSGAVELGTLAGTVKSASNFLLADAVIGTVGVVAFCTNLGGAYYLYSDADDSNFPTFQADTHSNTTIDNLGGTGAATTGIYVGQLVTGSGIPVNTRVATVSATSFTITNAATATATITVTKEALSKIIDSDFPANPVTIVAMDGYFFSHDERQIFQSAINDPSSWSSSDTIGADAYGDSLSFIFRHGQYIVAAGGGMSLQYFYNAGNAIGSVLSAAQNLDVAGLYLRSAPVPLWAGGAYCIGKSGSSFSGAPGVGLYRLTGANTFTRVGDSIWSSIIGDLALDRIGHANMSNKSTVVAHADDQATVVVYDEDTNEFSLLSLDAALTSSDRDDFTKSGSSSGFVWSTGNVWTDSSSAYTLTAQTQPHMLNNGSPFVINYVDLIADTEASGTATLYVSRDDYATWQSVGTFDMTAQRKRIWALGWFQSNVSFKIEHSANTNFRAQALGVGWAPCGR